MASSTEADLTKVIPLLVDGIAQEIGAERRDVRVTFVADHKKHDLSAWSELKYKFMEETKFVWQRPNDLNHPRPYFEITLDNESLLMPPISITSECVPKDIKGSQAYTEPGQPASLWQAGSYGSALSTLRTKLLAAMEGNFTTKAAPRLTSVVQYQLGTHVKRTKIPCKTDPTYGHVQLDTSGAADAEDYDAQISALMEGRTPGATTSGLSGGYATHSAAAVPTAKAMPKSSTSTTRPCPTSQGGQANKIKKIQDVKKTSFPLTPIGGSQMGTGQKGTRKSAILHAKCGNCVAIFEKLRNCDAIAKLQCNR